MRTLCGNCRIGRINNKTGHTHTDTKERIKIRNKGSACGTQRILWEFFHGCWCDTSCITEGGLHKYHQRPESNLQAACSLPKHHFFQLALKNIVTLYAWQNREPGRLVGLPYIIGDLTNIFSSVRLCHIVQCQHFSIGTIYPRVLE